MTGASKVERVTCFRIPAALPLKTVSPVDTAVHSPKKRMLRNAHAKDLGPLCWVTPQRFPCSPSFRALTIYTPRLSRLKQRNTRAATAPLAPDLDSDDPGGKRFHPWNRLNLAAVPDTVKNYDGTKSKFNSMTAALLVFLGAADFILTSAPIHYATMSAELKADSDASALEFDKYFGPMNLRMAHNDVINILLPIFSKFAHTKECMHAEIIRKHGRFPATATWDSIRTAYTASTDFVCDATMKLLTLASSFNGDNWPSLDTELGLTLEAVSDSALTIDDLIAMHLLHGIQVAGQNNTTWAAAHLDLIKMKQKNWHKDANLKPDRLKTILYVARETVKLLDHDVDYKPAPRLSAFLSGQPSTILGQKCKNCPGCLQHCVDYGGPQPKWRTELAALRRKPRSQAMLCDVDAGPDSDEAADLRMETLANTFANDSAAARAKCLQAFLATRVSSGSQHLSPYLEDHPELRERDFVDPYP